jgi:RNA polymerase sigma-70 factor (ECF subfamily)
MGSCGGLAVRAAAPVAVPVGAPVNDDPWTPPSWDEVVRTHSARVYRLAYRLTGNPHDAEDLTQEVFVRVFRSL